MADYYTLLTNIGRAKLANAHVTGVAVQITEFAVGDGGGAVYNPAEDATGLAGETFRAAPNQIYTDPDNPSWLVIEAVVPETTGGFYVREAGVFDIDGDMIAIAKYPETYKPTLAEGSGKDLYVRMVLEFSNTSDVVLKIDPSIVLATRDYVDTEVAAVLTGHAGSRDHPAATTDAQGMVELATAAEAVAGVDTTRAVTPLAATAAVLAAVTVHETAGDPHPQYASAQDLDAHEAAANPHAQYARLASGPAFAGSLSAVQGVRSNIGPDHTAYLGCGYVDASTRGWWLNRYGPDHPTMPHETIMYLGWVNDNPYHGGAVRVLPGWGINFMPPDFAPSDAVHVSGHRIKTEADTWESAAQTIVPGGSLTLAHTLPAAPKWYSAHIVCVTANNGYAVGDETEMTDPPIVSNCPPVAIVPSAANLFARVTNQAFGVIHKTTGQNVAGSASDWALIIRAGV